MSSPPLLTIERLTVGYRPPHPAHVVAQELQLHLFSGQLVCLLGPNGAGKSTLLRTLAGMHPPLAGDILLNGRSLPSLTASQRAAQLAVVLTEPPYANLSAYDLIAMGRYPYTGWLGRLSEQDRQAVVHAMEVTKTYSLANRWVGTLSDGERQKVMIARAVAQDTPLLILDEPTAHLDVPNRTSVFRLLLQLAQAYHKTVILSTHDLDMALLMADRLWLLHEGTIHEGLPEDLALSGKLATVFAHEGVMFDLHSGTFRAVRPEGTTVGLEGPMPEVFWTQRALERVGYTVIKASTEAPSVRVRDNPLRWIIHQSTTTEVYSLEELLRVLQHRD